MAGSKPPSRAGDTLRVPLAMSPHVRRAPPRGRPIGGWLAVLALLTFAAVFARLPDGWTDRLYSRIQAHLREQPTVILVLVDGLRADRTSACGYDRPTTPTLEALVEGGAAIGCGGVAAASAPLPSAASYLTGFSVLEHGLDSRRRFGPDGREEGGRLNPLDAAYTTLAESYTERGYQSVLISENPLWTLSSGLRQGYSVAGASRRQGGAHRPWAEGELKGVIGSIDTSRPLFLTVVLSGAREPFGSIPKRTGWLPERRGVDCARSDAERCRAFLAGEMLSSEEDDWTEALGDLYDFALWRTDAQLGRILRTLGSVGWLSGDHRLIVAGTYGEALGEHGALGRGRGTWQHQVEVPVLVAGNSAGTSFPDVYSTRGVYSLAAGGAFDATPLVETVASPPGSTPRALQGLDLPRFGVSRRVGNRKESWQDGEWTVYNLASDPGEAFGERVDAVEVPELAALVTTHLDKLGRQPLVILPDDEGLPGSGGGSAGEPVTPGLAAGQGE